MRNHGAQIGVELPAWAKFQLMASLLVDRMPVVIAVEAIMFEVVYDSYN